MTFAPFAETVTIYKCSPFRVVELLCKGLYEFLVIFSEYRILRERRLLVRTLLVLEIISCTGIENEIDGLATVASTGSYNDLIDTPTLPPTVNKKIETLSTATGTFTATGYIVAVTVLDSVTKEQVMADITYNSFSDDANSSVIVTCAEAPTNPLKVIITSIS